MICESEALSADGVQDGDVAGGSPRKKRCLKQVVFEASCNITRPGDLLLVVGSHPSLGEWQVSRALRLQTQASAFPNWRGSVFVEPQEVVWKLAIQRAGGKVQWEAGDDRRTALPRPGKPGIVKYIVGASFGEATHTLSPCGDVGEGSAVERPLCAVPDEAGLKEPPALKNHRITWNATCGCTCVGDILLVVGNAPELGGWDSRAGLRLETSPALFPVWRGHASISSCTKVEWKLVKQSSDGFFTWETCDNRRLALPSHGNHGDVSIRHAFGSRAEPAVVLGDHTAKQTSITAFEEKPAVPKPQPSGLVRNELQQKFRLRLLSWLQEVRVNLEIQKADPSARLLPFFRRACHAQAQWLQIRKAFRCDLAERLDKAMLNYIQRARKDAPWRSGEAALDEAPDMVVGQRLFSESADAKNTVPGQRRTESESTAARGGGVHHFVPPDTDLPRDHRRPRRATFAEDVKDESAEKEKDSPVNLDPTTLHKSLTHLVQDWGKFLVHEEAKHRDMTMKSQATPARRRATMPAKTASLEMRLKAVQTLQSQEAAKLKKVEEMQAQLRNLSATIDVAVRHNRRLSLP